MTQYAYLQKTRPYKRAKSGIGRAVVSSDAYWGWYGMIGSGMNAIVGGGMAATGSFFVYMGLR
ncbi:MAG: hypothetical protein ACK5KP_01170 [Paludibacteraceae bacterium]